MRIVKNLDKGVLRLDIGGRLDTTAAPILEAEIQNGLDGVGSLVLNLAGLEGISSAGMRVVLRVHKTMKKRGGMEVEGLNGIVRTVFDVTGFSSILNVI